MASVGDEVYVVDINDEDGAGFIVAVALSDEEGRQLAEAHAGDVEIVWIDDPNIGIDTVGYTVPASGGSSYGRKSYYHIQKWVISEVA